MIACGFKEEFMKRRLTVRAETGSVFLSVPVTFLEPSVVGSAKL